MLLTVRSGYKTKCHSQKCFSGRAGADICCYSDEENPCENIGKDADNNDHSANMDAGVGLNYCWLTTELWTWLVPKYFLHLTCD